MTELAILITIILFPGIIATMIADKIIDHNTKWDSFKYGIYSFVFGVSSYILLQVDIWAVEIVAFIPHLCHNLSVVDLFSNLGIWSIVANSKAETSLLEISQATLLSPPIAFFAAYITKEKWLNEFSQWIGASDKYGDENLFTYYFNSEAIDWIYIRDKENGLTYQGRFDSFSENDKIQEIVLYNVTVYSYENSEELYSLPSIYLSKTVGKFIIEEVPEERWEEEEKDHE